MRVIVTGHRPPRLCGSYENWKGSEKAGVTSSAFYFILEHLKKLIDADPLLGKIEAGAGMAQGADWLFCAVCLKLEIPYTAFLPYPTFGSRWPSDAQEDLGAFLKCAAKVERVSSRYYPGAETDRDRYMVEWAREAESSLLVAAWDGEPGGGTHLTICEAQKVGMKVVGINPATGKAINFKSEE